MKRQSIILNRFYLRSTQLLALIYFGTLLGLEMHGWSSNMYSVTVARFEIGISTGFDFAYVNIYLMSSV